MALLSCAFTLPAFASAASHASPSSPSSSSSSSSSRSMSRSSRLPPPAAASGDSPRGGILALGRPSPAPRARGVLGFFGARVGRGGGEHVGRRVVVVAPGPPQVVRRPRSVPSPSASLFGVGAPEALVIGVVALIVFGPKGLAEVARNIGKTLRTFQPTIRELQEVTRDFKETLQQEIGLDDIRNPTAPPPPLPPKPVSTISVAAPPAENSAPPAPPPQAYTADDMARVTEEQLKRALEASAVSDEAKRASELAAWKGSPPAKPAANNSAQAASPPEQSSEIVQASPSRKSES